MSETSTKQLNIVCVATYFKGADFARECHERGHRVVLVTKEKFRDAEWPKEALHDFFFVPDDFTPDVMVHAITQIARHIKIDRLVALEEFDVITTGLVREHLLIPGPTSAKAKIFRDKLMMRVRAKEAGILAPDFVHVLNYDDLKNFMQRVPPPWVMKPRADVSAIGIKKLHDAEQVWRAIDALDEREHLSEQSSYYLLERFVPGNVFHVDSLVLNNEPIFAGVNGYGRPPMNVSHEGGVFISHTLDYESEDRKELLDLNHNLIKALGLRRGATHAEFIKSDEDGKFYFLEIASRVGGAYIAETLEAASGINIWREWANIEIAGDEGEYTLPPSGKDYSGIALSLAKQEYPDTSAYTDEEIVYRIKKPYHAGLIVRSNSLARVKELLDQYAERFDNDFVAVAPVPERPPR
jgi:biotin carboxylase